MDEQSRKSRRYRIVIFALTMLAFFALRYVPKLEFFDGLEKYMSVIRKLSNTLTVVMGILLVQSLIEKLITNTERSHGDKYNLFRIVRLIAMIMILYVFVTYQYQDTYAFITGLGLISLVLGFALQAPITSFIAWLYIIFRRPYQVGDRIQIGNQRGDVIEISYLDTTVEEIRGDYLGLDRKSGRLIHFANSRVLMEQVINYAAETGFIIWDETAIQMLFNADLAFVEETLLRVAKEDFREHYPKEAKTLESEYQPLVYFRVSHRGWLEAVISYPVRHTDTTGRRNRILRAALPILNDNPDKVQFPSGGGARRSA